MKKNQRAVDKSYTCYFENCLETHLKWGYMVQIFKKALIQKHRNHFSVWNIRRHLIMNQNAWMELKYAFYLLLKNEPIS